jgi:4-aminobutyrate aminotransferase-like enzyme/Ser/Thr protein kinase RdoA (MazF antagonist)
LVIQRRIIEAFVLEQYAIEAEASLLYGEKDLNFLLQSGGTRYILKVADPGASGEELEFQIRAMRHVAGHSLLVATPQVILNRNGESLLSFLAPDGPRWVHLLSYIPGIMWARTKPHPRELLREAGRAVGALDLALRDFDDPGGARKLKWDLARASWIRDYLPLIENPELRERVAQILAEYEDTVVPKLQTLRRQVIYNDANDHNIICGGSPGNRQVAGLIDFGDAVESNLICDLAIACAYLMMGQSDPVGAACEAVAGFHDKYPLEEAELELLFPLIAMRLAVSVTNAAWQKDIEPENDYLQVSTQPAWDLLEELDTVHPRLAHYRFRAACGFAAVPRAPGVEAWLRAHSHEFASLVTPNLETCPKIIADWTAASLEVPNPDAYRNPARMTAQLWAQMAEANVEVAIGGYNIARLTPSEGFGDAEQRSIHTGLDVFLEAGSPVFAPFEGTVHSFANNTARYDYGPCIVLEHKVSGLVFWTLYGHLSVESLAGIEVGATVGKGEQIGQIGSLTVNGGWPPHLHFQIVTDMLDRRGDYPGACVPSQRDVWLSLSPDPNLVARIPPEFFSAPFSDAAEILEQRRKRLGYNLSLSYRRKLHIVRGYEQWLYDSGGQRYLDCVNNVPHVGHCHPRVVEAGQRQMAVLNTNTRYLHELLVEYAGRLTAKFPIPLSVSYFVNSGSEANELALRLARAHTRQKDMVVVDSGYHGNTTSVIDISPYKFDHKGGAGAPDWVQKAVMPDVYRGPYKAGDPDAGAKYARHIGTAIDKIHERDRGVAAFICEGILSCGGQVVLPPGYLAEAYRIVRHAGGVCIADEVQTGFGRVGTHFWAFETQGVVPDIVTLGKPIGNGHPLGAVVTTPEIAASFHNGLEYFNTFGGNAVSCAIGLAVLDTIEAEGLQPRALQVGAKLRDGFRQLMRRHPIIGDVRGLGLFCGFEMVRDRNTLAPATEEASYLANRMRDRRILMSTDGPLENVIKIKPPLCFDEANVDRVLQTLDDVLEEDFLRA